MSVFASIASLTMIAQTARTAVPYVLASQGGVWSERSGVVNVALEGMMLAGGLAGVAVARTHGPIAGVVAALAIGAALGAAHAAVTELGRIDAIVTGVAINIIALGGTRVVMRALYQSSSNSPSIDGFAGRGSSMVARVALDPMSFATIAAVVMTMLVLRGTRFGLRVRACGEGPLAARAAGIAVVRTRVLAVSIGGALAGLAGAALAYDEHQFQSGMSGGRGFMALAAVVLSGWRPGRAALVCVVFAALDALQGVLQGHARALQDLVQMLPFVAALVALAIFSRSGGTGGPPAGLGVHAE
ncbi:MAG TPA: ABC transporter permease [Polyangiaceae bacterium]